MMLGKAVTRYSRRMNVKEVLMNGAVASLCCRMRWEIILFMNSKGVRQGVALDSKPLMASSVKMLTT